MARKRNILKSANRFIPASISYALRQAIGHKSVAQFADYEQYSNARAVARLSSSSERKKEFEGKLELLGPNAYIEKYEKYIAEGNAYDRRSTINYVRALVTTGDYEKVCDVADVAPAAAKTDPTFRRNVFVSYVGCGRLYEAEDYAMATLAGGWYNNATLLRFLAEFPYREAADLSAHCAKTLLKNTRERLSHSETIFVLNSILNTLGVDEALSVVTPGMLKVYDADCSLYLSNFEWRRGNYAGQIRHLNEALAGFDNAPLALIDDKQPFSVTNIDPSHDLPSIQGGPMVSIMMSTFNATGTVVPVLNSLCAQTYRNIEILIVDDCSSDDTVEVVTRYSKEVDQRVRVFQQPENGGTYRARNRGMIEARGEFFTCNDSDDWAHPQKIERLIVAATAADRIGASSRFVRVGKDLGIKPRRNGYIHDDMSSMFYRLKPLVERIGYYESVRFGGDSEYNTRIALAFGSRAIGKLRNPLLFADWSRSSLSGSRATGISDGGTMAPRRVRYKAAYQIRQKSGDLFIGLDNVPIEQ